MIRTVCILLFVSFASQAFAQAPTIDQFTIYRNKMAQNLAAMADQEAICEANTSTLTKANQDLMKQITDLKAQLAKVKH